MKSMSAADIILLALKILIILAIVCSLCLLAFFSCRLVESFLSDRKNADDPGYHSGTGFYYFLSFVVLFALNVGIGILNGIGCVISFFYRGCSKRSVHLRFFRRCCIPPIATLLLYVVVLLILGVIF